MTRLELKICSIARTRYGALRERVKHCLLGSSAQGRPTTRVYPHPPAMFLMAVYTLIKHTQDPYSVAEQSAATQRLSS
jgi:hypothetical protein